MLTILFLWGLQKEGISRSPARRWTSILLASAAAACGLYVLIFYDHIASRPGMPASWDLALGLIFVLLLLEASRRSLGWSLPVLAGLFLIFASAGPYLPGRFAHRGYNFSEILENLFLTQEGIFGVAIGVSSTYIVVFILFGSVLEQFGMIALFQDLALCLAGWTRGGVAKVAVISSALMGTVNGSAIANVVTVGSFTIPLMKSNGFSSTYAAAVEATASMGGQLMPPVMGVAAFLMADMLRIPYLQVAVAAAIPACLYFFAAGAMIHFRAVRDGLQGIPRAELPRLRVVLRERSHLLLPLLGLLYLMVRGFTPTYCALAAILLAVVVVLLKTLLSALLPPAARQKQELQTGKSSPWSVLGRELRQAHLTLPDLASAIDRGVRNTVVVATACGAVGIIIGVVTQTGVGLKLSSMILDFSGNSLWLAALLTMVSCIVLGMGLPTIPTYIICVIMAAPALLKLGVLPLAAHLFVMYFGTLADLTPPVMLATYAAAGIAGAPPLATGIQSVKLALAGFIVPYLFIQTPALLLQETGTWAVLEATLSAVMGTLALAAAVEGCLFRSLAAAPRLLLLAAAGLLLVPGIWSSIAGAALFLMIGSWDWITGRRSFYPPRDRDVPQEPAGESHEK